MLVRDDERDMGGMGGRVSDAAGSGLVRPGPAGRLELAPITLPRNRLAWYSCPTFMIPHTRFLDTSRSIYSFA